jgi:hypothetical protein
MGGFLQELKGPGFPGLFVLGWLLANVSDAGPRFKREDDGREIALECTRQRNFIPARHG